MASSCPVEVRSSILCPDYDKHSHDAHSIMNDGEEDYQVQVHTLHNLIITCDEVRHFARHSSN